MTASPEPPPPRVTSAAVEAALPHVDAAFRRTPLIELDTLSAAVGVNVLLKVETLNPIRCFKGRGSSVFVHHHRLAHADQPLVAASAGNWGQALALHATHAGLDITVFAATTANPTKLARMAELGASVRLVGRDFDEAKEAAFGYAARHGARLAEDGRHRSVTAGHGSCAVELTDAGARIDAVLVPLGNAALVNGIGAWFADVDPSVEIVAVSAAGAPATHQSFVAGRLITTGDVSTIADGLAVRTPIPVALDDMRHAVDTSTTVTDEALRQAQKLVLDHVGLVTEPSGVAGIAALLAAPDRWAGRTCVAIVTGSNVDVRS